MAGTPAASSARAWRAIRRVSVTRTIIFRGRAETSWRIRLLILCVFIALLHLGVSWGRLSNVLEDQILAFIIFISGLMLLELDSPESWHSNSRLTLLFGSVWFNLVIIKGIYLHWFMSGDSIYMGFFYFVAPCTFAPFLVTLLAGTRAGLFSVVQVSMLAPLLTDRGFIFLLVSLLSGFTAVYFTQNVRKRADLLKAGLAVGCLNLLCAIILGVVHGRSPDVLGWQALFGIGAGIGTAMVVSAILPLVEGAFQITTTISWLELAD